jgi:hypothetical protein
LGVGALIATGAVPLQSVIATTIDGRALRNKLSHGPELTPSVVGGAPSENLQDFEVTANVSATVCLRILLIETDIDSSQI